MGQSLHELYLLASWSLRGPEMLHAAKISTTSTIQNNPMMTDMMLLHSRGEMWFKRQTPDGGASRDREKQVFPRGRGV